MGELKGEAMANSAAKDIRFPELDSLRQRINGIGIFSNKEPDRFAQRINALEEKLLRLEQQSLERAQLGMEQLAKKYLPKLLAAASCVGFESTSNDLIDSPPPD